MLEYLIKDEIVSSDDRIAVGVSGGADSMLLLWALIDKQKQSKFYLKVINVNHGLRGEESDHDSEFVKNFCEKKKIPYEIVAVDAKKLKQEEKLTIEESARKLRYDAFYKLMKKDKLNKLFLAHNKNDQAETILMNIFRGAGLSGASGMKERENIFRPLIELSKNEIYKLASEHGVKFVEDSTNTDSSYSRNFIRNVLIPQIETKYGNVVDSICLFGKKCEEAYKSLIQELNEEFVICGEDGVTILGDVFNNSKFLIYEYVKLAYSKLDIFSNIEEKHIDLICSLASAEVNKMINLPHKTIARKTYTGIKISKENDVFTNFDEHLFSLGETDIDGFGKISSQIVDGDEVEYGDGNLYIDYLKVPAEAVWRKRKIGDVFSKLGTGSKKLNDYFTDKKIEFDKRDLIPILAYQNQVLVVAGFDVSEKVKVDGKTEQIVKISFETKF